MVAAFLILPNVGVLGQAASDFCTSASHTAFSILIMLIMANLCYRYGMFGRVAVRHRARRACVVYPVRTPDRAAVERAVVRTGRIGCRRQRARGHPRGGSHDDPLLGKGAVQPLGRVVSGRGWHGGRPGHRKEAKELANRCQELARSYGLSPREEEVLLLLAQRKTVGSIERELFIANGTAKTHIRHIYRKLDIHSRDELSDLLGLFE